MKDFDKIITSAFSRRESPSPVVNQRILLQSQYERVEKMKKSRKFRKILVAAALIVVCAVPVYRAVKLLLPSQVAQKSGDLALAKAFESEDAIIVNETQSSGGYDVTLMGIVSGENISDINKNTPEDFLDEKTYRVVAVQKSDGTKITDITERPELFISPYIKGCHPNLVNIASLKGGYHDMVVDGVMYRLIDCDSIEVFASTEVYLGVSEGMLLPGNAFVYNKDNGTIMRNPDYEGVNALFDLPLDTSKADPDKALEIIKSLVG